MKKKDLHDGECFKFLVPVLEGWTIKKVSESTETREGGLVLFLEKGKEWKEVTLGFNDLGMWISKEILLHGGRELWTSLTKMLEDMTNHLLDPIKLKNKHKAFDNKNFFKMIDTPFECDDSPLERRIGFKCKICKQTWHIGLSHLRDSEDRRLSLIQIVKGREYLAKRSSIIGDVNDAVEEALKKFPKKL